MRRGECYLSSNYYVYFTLTNTQMIKITQILILGKSSHMKSNGVKSYSLLKVAFSEVNGMPNKFAFVSTIICNSPTLQFQASVGNSCKNMQL
jgi:hypothetical protein